MPSEYFHRHLTHKTFSQGRRHTQEANSGAAIDSEGDVPTVIGGTMEHIDPPTG